MGDQKSVHPPTCHGTEEVHCVTTDGENGHRHSTAGVNKLWSDVEINQTFENRSLSCFAKSRTNFRGLSKVHDFCQIKKILK